MLEPTSRGVMLSALVVGLAGCSHTVSGKEVEKKIAETLSSKLGRKVTAKCPGNLEAKKGKVYPCTASTADQTTINLSVVMHDDSGHYSVSTFP